MDDDDENNDNEKLKTLDKKINLSIHFIGLIFRFTCWGFETE